MLPRHQNTCKPAFERLEARLVLNSTHPTSWLENKSGYGVNFYGINPASSDLGSTMLQLATQYDVPIEIVAAVCYEESNVRQFDPKDSGFIVRNAIEDCKLFFGQIPPSAAPPGLGLMQLTGGTARQFNINQLITNWRYNLSAGVQVLSQAYASASSTDPPWMQTLDRQNRNILEN